MRSGSFGEEHTLLRRISQGNNSGRYQRFPLSRSAGGGFPEKRRARRVWDHQMMYLEQLTWDWHITMAQSYCLSFLLLLVGVA